MKKIWIQSAIPIYGAAAVWVVMGLLFPTLLLRMWFLALTAVLSAVAYFGLSKVFKGREMEVREAAHSGDRAIDALIEQGRARLDSLRAADAAIEDAQISENLKRMVAAGEEIFRLLEADTSKNSAVRRFMNYYLPTVEKLMSSYQMLQKSPGKGENIAHTLKTIENSLDMIAAAFEKQLDNLYRDRSLDIETDIEALETMLACDGLTQENGFGKFEAREDQSQAD